MKYRCRCCGYRTLEHLAEGTYELCPVCYWEDDPVQAEDENRQGGANGVSLKEARENFKKYGAIEERFKDNVRPPHEDEKPIEYHAGIFHKFKTNPNLDEWMDFPDIMWGLGYDMDCHESFNKYADESPLKVKPHQSERERKRNILYYLEHAPRQIIGNCLFSEWRYLTHWSMSGYTEYDVDFLRRIIYLLENKYDEPKQQFTSVDEFASALGFQKMNLIGEDDYCRYYLEDMSAYENMDVGLPTVIEEYKPTHEFIVLDADTANDVMKRFL